MSEESLLRSLWVDNHTTSKDRKSIVCFGDSFIMSNNAIINGTHCINVSMCEQDINDLYKDYKRISPEYHLLYNSSVRFFDEGHDRFHEFTSNWMTQTAMELDYDFVSYGMSGTGTFYSYYQMINYLNQRRPPDVVIFVLNQTHRIFNRHLINLCPGTIINSIEQMENDQWHRGDKAKKIVESAQYYFADLFDHEHEIDKLIHTCYYFDNHIVPQYPDTKFIILHSFNEYGGDYTDPGVFKYVYDFQNCMEIRPPLIYLSKLDDEPEDMRLEHRTNHFSERVRKAFSHYMAMQIQNFSTGSHFLDLNKDNLPDA